MGALREAAGGLQRLAMFISLSGGGCLRRSRNGCAAKIQTAGRHRLYSCSLLLCFGVAEGLVGGRLSSILLLSSAKCKAQQTGLFVKGEASKFFAQITEQKNLEYP